jgi:hypothetical protein
MDIANAMEKEEAARPKKDNGLDEDQAIAAFAQNLNDEGSEDPQIIKMEMQKK